MSERDPFFLRVARRVSVATCALTMGIGIIVLVGWLTQIQAFKSVVPGLVSMKPNTAIALTLLGTATLLLRAPGRVRQRAAVAISALAGLVAALTLVEYAGHWDFGIDELLFRDDPNPVGTSHPGRMSPLAAICILFQSTAIGCLAYSPTIGQRFSLGTLLLALLVLAGYMYDVPHLKGVATYTEMAIHTAFAFLLLSVAGLVIRPTEGLVSILLENSVGGLMARRLLPMLAAVVFALGWIVAFGTTADLYDERFGLSIFLVLSIATSALVIWGNAHSLHQIDMRRRQAEREIREQREWLEITLGSIVDAVVATDTDGKVLFLNAVAEQLTGWNRQDAIGQPFSQVFRPVDEASGELCEVAIADALDGKRTVRRSEQSVLVARDGVRRWIDDSVAPIVHQDGSVLGAVLVFRDVTEQRKLERERAKLAALVNSSEDAILSYDFDGVVTYWNPGAERLYGFRAAEIVGRRMTDTIVPADRASEMVALFERIRRGELVEDLETERVRKDGAQIEVYLRASPVKAPDGTLLGVSAIDRDITSRRQVERRRNIRMAVTQALNDSTTPESAIREALRAICQTMGWDVGCEWKRESPGDRFVCQEIVVPGQRDASGIRELLTESCQAQESQILEKVGYREQPHWVPQASTAAISDPLREFAQENGLELIVTVPVIMSSGPSRTAGQHAGTDGNEPPEALLALQFFGRSAQPRDEELMETLSSVASQIAAFLMRREAETELRRSERTLADFFENAAIGLHWVGPDGTILRANRAELEMLGYSRDEYIGHHIREFHADQRVIGDILDRLASGEVLHNVESELICKDGSLRHVLIDTNVLWDNDQFVHTRCFTRDVTERVSVEAALRNSEQQFRLLMEQAADAIFIANLEGHLLEVNDSTCALLGYSHSELLGVRVTDLIHPEERGQLEETREALVRGEIQRAEWHLQQAGGDYVPVEISARMLPQGRWQAICRDITERKRAEKAIRDSERLYRAIGESIDYGVWVCDREGGNVYLSTSFLELVGRTQEECRGTGWAESLHPDDRDRVVEAWERCVQTAGVWDTEFSILGADGQYHPILSRGVPVRDEEGEILRWAGINLNIGRMKTAEDELRESQKMFRLLSNSIPQLAWMARPDGEVFWYNQRWYEFTGTTEDEMRSAGWHLVVDPEERARVLAKWQAALEAGSPWEDVFPLRRHDGVMRWHLSRAMPVKDERGHVARWFGTNTDITERKQTEAMLQFLADASESLSALVDVDATLSKVAELAVPAFADWCAIDLVNEQGQLTRLSLAHSDSSKVELAKELGQSYPASREDAIGSGRTAHTGKSQLLAELTDQDLQAIAKNEEHLEVLRKLSLKSLLCVPLSIHGRLVAVLSFAMAESGRRFGNEDLKVALDLANRAAVAIENARLYQEVRDADRAKDEFLAMLAHELRNPLAPIHSGLELLAIDPGPHHDTVAVMQQQVNHLVRLVDDLLDVSRIMRGRIELRKETIPLQSVVEQAVTAVEGAIRGREQKLKVELPEAPVWLDVDPVRLAQVLENLLTNAAKYTDQGGDIHLHAATDDGMVAVRVKDSGVGIEPALLPKVFDLFSQSARTLDRSQGGLGIGLTLVRTLVEMHGGLVSVTSAGVGLGSEFKIELPIAQAAAEPTEDAKPVVTSPVRRILVVDDNRGAAKMLSRLLEKMDDHIIEVAFDGTSAVERARDFQPEVILLDLGLPGMDGFEVARVLRTDPKFDGVVIAALTGYGQEEDRRRTRESGFDEHLVKPPSSDALRALMNHPRLAKGSTSATRMVNAPDEDPGPAATPSTPASVPAAHKAQRVSEAAGRDGHLELQDPLREAIHELGNAAHALSLLKTVGESEKDQDPALQRMLAKLAESLADSTRRLKELRKEISN